MCSPTARAREMPFTESGSSRTGFESTRSRIGNPCGLVRPQRVDHAQDRSCSVVDGAVITRRLSNLTVAFIYAGQIPTWLAGVAIRRNIVIGRPLASIGVTVGRSIVTATDRFRRVTETTMRCGLAVSKRIPSKPAKGPSSIRTRWPTSRKEQGSTQTPDLTVV